MKQFFLKQKLSVKIKGSKLVISCLNLCAKFLSCFLKLSENRLEKNLQLNKYKFINGRGLKTICRNKYFIEFLSETIIRLKQLTKEIETKIKQWIITRLLSTPKGKEKLARAMIQPLRRRMDYESIGRSLISVQPMSSEGALLYYDRS